MPGESPLGAAFRPRELRGLHSDMPVPSGLAPHLTGVVTCMWFNNCSATGVGNGQEAGPVVGPTAGEDQEGVPERGGRGRGRRGSSKAAVEGQEGGQEGVPESCGKGSG